MDEIEIDSPEWRKLVGKDDQVFSDKALEQAQLAADLMDAIPPSLRRFTVPVAAYQAACRAVGVTTGSPTGSRYRKAVDAALSIALPAELRRLASAWEHLRAAYPSGPGEFDRVMGSIGGYPASLLQLADAWETRT
jgi:hypothetical protein